MVSFEGENRQLKGLLLGDRCWDWLYSVLGKDNLKSRACSEISQSLRDTMHFG